MTLAMFHVKRSEKGLIAELFVKLCIVSRETLFKSVSRETFLLKTHIFERKCIDKDILGVI